MIILKRRRFSIPGLNNSGLPHSKTINTAGGMLGFNRSRNYDQDFNRLGRNETTRQLTQTRQLHEEMRKLNSELNEGRRGKWLDTD